MKKRMRRHTKGANVRHTQLICCCLGIVALSSGHARADTIGAYLRNTDWLVDSSDIVLIGKKTDDNRTEVLALLKSPKKYLVSHAVGKQISIRTLDDSKRAVGDEYDLQYYRKALKVGERALFFLRLSKSNETCLSKRISLDKPMRIDLEHPGRGEIIEFYGVDDGRPIKSAVELLQVVVDRIRLGPIASLYVDRENVEATNKLRPFNWRPVGAEWTHFDSLLSQNDWAFTFCSPIEEQFWNETITPKAAEAAK